MSLRAEPAGPVDVDPILPGATLGVFGGGQLGRMFALAARRMGYRVRVYTDHADSPAGQVADEETVASFDDLAAVERFGRSIAVATFEFENVPSAPLARLAELVPVRPAPAILHVTQERLREKGFLRAHGFPTTDFDRIETLPELAAAAQRMQHDAILKTASFGYDGKGQSRIRGAGDVAAAHASLNGALGILERRVDFACELSVIVARSSDGSCSAFPVAENQHVRHILDASIVPARLSERVQTDARELALSIARALELEGVLAVELFLTRDGQLLVNELAPRPHNSGHYSFDACATSQFEQQVRAVCGLPLGSTELLRPCVMINLLGDLWRDGALPRIPELLSDPLLKLHLYGKGAARPGRKLGHLVCLGDSPADAWARAARARERLRLPALS
jgi:5-(carboxyamino)imidazole ribonucleotide synthase